MMYVQTDFHLYAHYLGEHISFTMLTTWVTESAPLTLSIMQYPHVTNIHMYSLYLK